MCSLWWTVYGSRPRKANAHLEKDVTIAGVIGIGNTVTNVTLQNDARISHGYCDACAQEVQADVDTLQDMAKPSGTS